MILPSGVVKVTANGCLAMWACSASVLTTISRSFCVTAVLAGAGFATTAYEKSRPSWRSIRTRITDGL
jgi:hypothetical protein